MKAKNYKIENVKYHLLCIEMKVKLLNTTQSVFNILTDKHNTPASARQPSLRLTHVQFTCLMDLSTNYIDALHN